MTSSQPPPQIFINHYQEHQFLDAKDNQGDWRVGEIIDKIQSTKLIKVRFDGWSSKYDEVFKFNSAKLKPFRTVVLGYTGQLTIAGIRAGWKFAMTDLEYKGSLVTQREQICKTQPVHKINQIVRGESYLYTDFLMTITYESKEALYKVVLYFLQVIKSVFKYLEHFSASLQKFLEIQTHFQSGRSSEEYSREQTYLRCYYQIFDLPKIISGQYPRHSSFFIDNQAFIQDLFSGSSSNLAQNKYRQFIASEAQKLKGQEKLLSFLASFGKECTQFIPFLMLYSLSNFLHAIMWGMPLDFKDNAVKILIEVAESNILRMQELNFKDFHKTNLSNFLNSIEAIAQQSRLHQKVKQSIIFYELKICLKMICCPFFQKRLKGISGIQKLCQTKKEIQINGALAQWIKQSKLIQILFVNNDNPELIKKSAELVKYLNDKKILSDGMINMIWDSRIGKHQAALKEIYHLFSEFPSFESSAQKNIQIFKKIDHIQEKEWDQDYIQMIKQYSLNSLTKSTKSENFFTFGYQILYKYLLIYKTEQGQQQLVLILKLLQNNQFLAKFQRECFKKIQENMDPNIHISLLLRMSNQSLTAFKDLKIDFCFILTRFLIENCNNEECDLKNAFQLFAQILKITSAQLSLKQFQRLWTHFINSKHKKAFMKWIYKRKQNSRIWINSFVRSEYRIHLLEDLWPLGNMALYKQIDEDQVTFFIELMKVANIGEDRMKRVQSILIKVLSLSLAGYDQLWQILKESNNEKVVFLVIDFITEIHSSMNSQDLEESIENLVAKIEKQIKDAQNSKNIQYIEKLLQLTKRLIERDQQVYYISQTIRYVMYKDYIVTFKQKSEEKTIKFNIHNNFYEFKKAVSQKFHLPLHYFKLTYKNQMVPLDIYFKSMAQNSFNANFQLIYLAQDYSEIKRILDTKLDLFFELLGDQKIEKQVWSIVSKLPISEEPKLKIIRNKNILQDLSNQSIFTELYMLKVMLELKESWWKQFSNLYNIKMLTKSYKKIIFENDIEEEYLSTLTEIISQCLKSVNDQTILNQKNIFLDSLAIFEKFLENISKKGKRLVETEKKIIKNIFQIINQYKFPLQILTEFHDCQRFFILGLMLIEASLKKQFSENLKLIFTNISLAQQEYFLEIILKRMLPVAIQSKNKFDMRQYFDFVSKFLQKIDSKHLQKMLVQNQPNKQNFIIKVFNLIKKEPNQQNFQNINSSLYGYLSIFKWFAHLDSKQKIIEIFQYVLNQCLFSINNPKCKTKQSRMAAFNLLQSLIFDNNALMLDTLSHLNQYTKRGQWRTRKMDDWTISQSDKMKSPTGYVGLKNLGCICYMNSFLQQMFMIPTLRQAILACQDPEYHPKNQGQSVLFQLQKMFLNLELSEKKFYVPKEFCFAFKDYEGNPTNVSEQMDIDEFSGILFDRLENQMKHTKYQNVIKDTFGGILSNQIICKGCPHFSLNEQSFLSISLTVKNKKNVYQSFDAMIKGDNLDGDNAYFCERCNKKVSAVKRVCLKKLPNTLIVTLKRFQFDYEKMAKLKVNDYCQFPINLNLKEYSQQDLQKKQNSKALDDQQVYTADYYNYTLKGVVVHSGSADSGHYYSYIQERTGSKWLQFNDTMVKNFNIDDLADQTYGGEFQGTHQIKQKIRNAYLLIYERSTFIPVNEMALPDKELIYQLPVYRNVISKINKQNKSQKEQNVLFSLEYTKFLNNIINQLYEFKGQMLTSILKYVIATYLTIIIREKNDLMNISVLKKIYPFLQTCAGVNEWIINLFSAYDAFDEFFKNNPMRQVKKLLAFWLVQVYKSVPEIYQNRFCNLLLTKITEQNENTSEICLILFQISSHPKTLKYLASCNIVGRLVENMVRKQPRMFVEKLPMNPNEPSQIGNEAIIEKTEAELNKKSVVDGQNAYVWAIINKIIKEASSSKTPLNKCISETEIEYLHLGLQKIYKILQEVKNKMQINNFVRVLCSLSFNQKQFSLELTHIVERGLKQLTSKKFRQFFILFERLIQIQDQFQDVRLSGFEGVMRALTHNQQYLMECNIIQQWILILVNRNENLRIFLQHEKSLLMYLKNIAIKKVPGEQYARKNIVYSEITINKLHGVKFPKTKKGYIKLGKEMQEFYSKIEEQKYFESPNWQLQDGDIQTPIQIGDTVAYFDTKDKIDYEQMKVDSVFLGKIDLSSKKGKTISVWKDDEKLSKNIKLSNTEDQQDLDSSKTTQMDLDEQDIMNDAF